MMSATVNTWWFSLCTVAAMNILAWLLTAVVLQRKAGSLPADLYAARRLQLLLSAIYTFGCAYRSVFLVFDVPRVVVIDSWFSSIVVGRTVATCAELAFVAQWALLLGEAARTTGSAIGRYAARAVLPLIVVAEICSWGSVLTTANLGHTAEETLWGLSAALMVVGIAIMMPRLARAQRTLMGTWGTAGVAYVIFMFLHDVPMYWTRWVADQAAGRQYLTLAQGFRDVAMHRAVSDLWSVWRSEVPWMSLYFSVAVWISIALVHAPAFRLRTADEQLVRSRTLLASRSPIQQRTTV
jgi:hypothetical protein